MGGDSMAIAKLNYRRIVSNIAAGPRSASACALDTYFPQSTWPRGCDSGNDRTDHMTILILTLTTVIPVVVIAVVALTAVFHRRTGNRHDAYRVLSLLLRHRAAARAVRYNALATAGRRSSTVALLPAAATDLPAVLPAAPSELAEDAAADGFVDLVSDCSTVTNDGRTLGSHLMPKGCRRPAADR
jgi:hypothetical protein